MNENKKHLLVCAIGPVQDFIATARTSQDLRFGSWMLSELSKAASRAIFEEPHQLVFPAPKQKQDLEPSSTLGVANKIVAIVNGNPDTVATRASKAVDEHLEQLCQETYAKIKGRVDKQLAEEQVKDLVEFYWASVPYAGQQDYKKVRAQAEALLAARKNTRNFRQVNGREGIPKSSLDGFRESVLRPNSVDDDAFYTAYHAEQGEVLSGIDLLKRWGEIRARTFLSTTDLAAKPFLIMIKEKKQDLLSRIQKLLKEYTDRTETEGTHFYEERLAQLISDKTKRSEFRKRFCKIFQDEGIHQRPRPYYILLLADGDNMGKTIDAQDTLKKHRELSYRLSEFASTAQKIIADCEGVPIYMGGDDVLAYLPLHTALRCITDLNENLNQAMRRFSFSDGKGKHLPTLSGALVIAHHLTPLSNVLETARRAEREAKEVPDKNSLIIVLSKRGGVDRMAKTKVSDLVERMQVLIGYVRQKQISTGTAYEIQKLHQQLSEAELPPEVFRLEAIRVIQRKREAGGEHEVQEEVRRQFKRWFEDKNLTLDELAQEMVIAGEFARAYEMACVALNIGEKEAQV
jgi:CRISPR-associated protein Cmr2